MRIELLRSHGVEPVIVFDGGRLPIKGEEEASRHRCVFSTTLQWTDSTVSWTCQQLHDPQSFCYISYYLQSRTFSTKSLWPWEAPLDADCGLQVTLSGMLC